MSTCELVQRAVRLTGTGVRDCGGVTTKDDTWEWLIVCEWLGLCRNAAGERAEPEEDLMLKFYLFLAFFTQY